MADHACSISQRKAQSSCNGLSDCDETGKLFAVCRCTLWVKSIDNGLSSPVGRSGAAVTSWGIHWRRVLAGGRPLHPSGRRMIRLTRDLSTRINHWTVRSAVDFWNMDRWEDSHDKNRQVSSKNKLLSNSVFFRNWKRIQLIFSINNVNFLNFTIEQ
jgi:hypothetical protein